MTKKQWYIVHTYSGKERKVKEELEKKVKELQLTDKITNIVVPVEEVSQIRGGKKKKIEKSFFPGYILIEMEMDKETWSAIRYTPGVFGFISDKIGPIPIERKDIEEAIEKIKTGEVRIKEEVEFEINETVRIIEGPFKDFIGTIQEIDHKHGLVTLSLLILGRATPVQLKLYQIGKL